MAVLFLRFLDKKCVGTRIINTERVFKFYGFGLNFHYNSTREENRGKGGGGGEGDGQTERSGRGLLRAPSSR